MFKKQKFKRISLFILAIVLIISTGLLTPVSASNQPLVTWQGGSAFRVTGIRNLLSSSYTTEFTNAINNWSNNLYVRDVVVNSSGVGTIIDIDFSDLNFLLNNGLGSLYAGRLEDYGLYRNHVINTNCCVNHQGRSFHIYINKHISDSLSPNNKRHVISHEIGHALGLEDFWNTSNFSNYVMNNSSWSLTPHSSEFTKVDDFWH